MNMRAHHAHSAQDEPVLVGVVSQTVLDGLDEFWIWPQEVESRQGPHRDKDGLAGNDEAWLGHPF
jgi:hypothetical protein